MKPKSNQFDKTGTMDRCQTPDYALSPILPYLVSSWTIWEPCAGEGNIVKELQRQDYNVISTDILTGQNFFTYCPVSRWDIIITNPPYSLKYKILARCYQLGKPFALLLPLETLGSKQAQSLFEEYGLELILLNRRIDFKMPNVGWNGSSAQFPTAWFTNGLNIGSQLTFAKITKRPNEQMVLI